MRIAIDATTVPPKPAGAGTYAIELARAMADRDRRDGYAIFARGHWFDAMAAGKRNWRIERVEASRAGRVAWEQLALPGAMVRLGINVLHSTHHTLPLRSMRAKRVVTVHDVTFMRIPERYPLVRRLYMRAITSLSARVADAVIVPSRAVREDVRRLLNVPERKLHVVYEAAGSQYTRAGELRAQEIAGQHGMHAPFLLSVGSLEPGKNRERIIRAMRELRGEGVDLHLLIVGQPAWKHDDERRLVRELGMRDRVTYAGYVPSEDLPALYTAATAFVFPSLYEGFGLPVLEAMACGTPVLTSSLSATAEVAGDAALLVDPRAVSEIRDGIRALLTDDTLRRRLAAAGTARAAEFSWRRAAQQTHAVYEAVVAGAGTS